MQIAAETTKFQCLPGAMFSEFSVIVRQSQFSQYRAVRCNGAVVNFESSEIPVAVTKVFLGVGRVQGSASAELQLQVIDDGIRTPVDPGRQTGSAPS